MSEDNPTEPLRFHRIYVPADRESDWPAKNMTLEPIEAREFEELVQAMGGTRTKSPRAARIETAILSATLTNDNTISGSATFAVSRPRNDDTSGPESRGATDVKPTLTPFGPCGIAITNPVWRSKSNLEGTARPAFIGVDADGRQLLLTNDSGELACDWSLTGLRNTAGQMSFMGDLPPCVRCRIKLELPENQLPVVVSGIVSRLDSARAGFKLWQIDLGNSRRLEIRLLDRERDSATGTGFVRQLTTYRCSPQGVDIFAEFNVDVFDKPLGQFPILFDDSVDILQAKLGDTPVPWSIRRDGKHRLAIVHFHKPIQGPARRITIRAVSPISRNQVAALPRLRPGALNWMKGKINLLVHEPLQLAEMTIDKGRQSKLARLAEMNSGEAVEVQCFSADCTVNVLLQRIGSTLGAAAATMIEVSDDQINGRMVVDLTATGDARYSLQATVHGAWQLDENDITTEPIDALTVEVSPNGKRVSLRLKEGLTDSNPLRLTVSARIPNFRAGQSITQDALRMLSFAGTDHARNVFHLRSRSSHRLSIENDGLIDRLNTNNRLAADESRLDKSSPVLAWLDVPGQDQLRISLQQESPNLAAHHYVEAHVAQGLVHQQLRIACAPQSAAVDRVSIHVSRPSANARWHLTTDNASSIVQAVRWTAEQNRTAGFTGGETWEIVLPRPLSESFDLIQKQTVPFSDTHAIPLISMLSATTQSGTVTIRSDGATALRIDQENLKPIPAARTPSTQYNSTRATFRYDANLAGARAQHARLIRTEAKKSQLSRHSFVWLAVVESAVDPKNGSEHRATLYLENHGRQRVGIQLPDDVKLRAVFVDGDKSPIILDAQSGKAFVELPVTRRFPCLTIVYNQGPLSSHNSFVRAIAQPAPQIDIPVITWRGVVHVPPGFQIANSVVEPVTAESANWQRLLFGPFARSPNADVFDPFEWESWNSSSNDGLTNIEFSAVKFLTRLGRTLNDRDHETLTWARLLRLLGTRQPNENSDIELPLWIDRTAVARIGIRPDSKVPRTQPNAAQQRAANLLQLLDLMLVADHHRIVLTASKSASSFSVHAHDQAARQTAVTNLPVLVTDRMAVQQPSAIVPAELWARGTAIADFPWQTNPPSEFHGTDLHGWSSSEHAFQAGNKQQLYIVHQTAMHTLSWTVFLVVFAGFCWRTPESFLARIIILTALCLFALLLPPVCAFVATSAFLGCLFALLTRAVHGVVLATIASLTALHEPAPHADSTSGERTVVSSTSAVISLLLIIAAAASSLAVAQEAEIPANAAAPDIYPVLITYDKDGAPITDYYYIPRQFREALAQRSEPAQRGPSGWLIRHAEYLGAIDQAGGNDRLSLARLVASFDVEVYGRETTLLLPFKQSQVDSDGTSVTLDGRPVKPNWRDELSEFSLQIPEPGTYRLKIKLRPNPEFIGAISRVEFEIPKLCTSQIQLDLPSGVRSVEVLSALGRVELDETRNRLTGHLGATDQLAISWRNVTNGVAAPLPIDVEQMVWLRIKPNVATIDAKLHINADRIRSLTMTADKRLRLLSCETSSDKTDGRVEKTITQPGDPQKIQIHFTKTLSGRFDVDLSFLVIDNPHQSPIAIPKLIVTDARSIRRWLAISLDSTLQIADDEVMLNEGLSDVAYEEFASRWDLGGLHPDLMFLQTKPSIDLSLPFSQQVPVTTASEHLAVSVADDHARIVYTADLVTDKGHTFVHRMQIPPALVAEQVSVVANDTQRIAHWSHHSNDQLTVFLDGPVSGPHQLQLFCRQARKGKSVRIPTIVLHRCQPANSLLSIYRQPSVTFALNGFKLPKHLQPASPPNNSILPADFGRHVATYQRAPSPRLSFPVNLNTPRMSANQVTRLRHESGEWRASVEVQLQIQSDGGMQPSGEVDEVHLRLPETWRGPFDVQPAAMAKHLSLVQASSGHLVIRPAQSITGKFQFTIDGAISIAPGDHVSAPQVTLIGASPYDRFVILPKRIDQQGVHWERSGLESRRLPATFSQPDSDGDSYLVTGQEFNAVLSSVERQAGVPQVKLSDVQINWRESGDYLGSVSYDLEPAGLAAVTLRLPDNECRLVQARVGGLAVAAFTNDQLEWQLPLSSSQLPQRIEVVFQGQWSQGHGERRQFTSPVLLNSDDEIDVSRTIWTINAPDGFGPVVSYSPSIPIGGHVQHCLDRFNQIENTLLNVTSEQSRDVLAPWYQHWVQHLQEVKREIEIAYFVDPASLDQEQARHIEAAISEISNRLIAQGAADGLSSNHRDPFAATQLWHQQHARGDQAQYIATDGPCASVALTYTSHHRSDIWQRLMIALLIAGGAGGLIYYGKHVTWLLESYPQVMCFLAGIVVWLWLWPSILGLVLVAVAILSSLRLGLQSA
jgi:hypothetical protein